MSDYAEFLEAKTCMAESFGFRVEREALNPRLLAHQAAIIPWMLEGGRRALFASFGLGKSIMQLEAVRLAAEYADSRGLIVLPLGVRQEFRRDAVEILGWSEPPKFIRSIGVPVMDAISRILEDGNFAGYDAFRASLKAQQGTLGLMRSRQKAPESAPAPGQSDLFAQEATA